MSPSPNPVGLPELARAACRLRVISGTLNVSRNTGGSITALEVRRLVHELDDVADELMVADRHVVELVEMILAQEDDPASAKSPPAFELIEGGRA
jgi:hypothetical protein